METYQAPNDNSRKVHNSGSMVVWGLCYPDVRMTFLRVDGWKMKGVFCNDGSGNWERR
jgi:hypothetical protein